MSRAIPMEILSASYLVSSPRVELCPKPDRPEFAFIGRSNVGKSSLINMLTRQKALAKTSGTPGKTQLINHFEVKSAADLNPGTSKREASDSPTGRRQFNSAASHWYLVDLPGYGYAKVSQQQRRSFGKMIADYLQKRENLVNVFVLIDSRHNPQAIDLDFLAQLGEWGVPFSLIFTKADKSTQREVGANVKRFLEKMKEEWQFLPRAIVTSAEKFHGRKELLGYIGELLEDAEEK